MVGASGSTWGSAPTGLNVLGVNANVLSSALPAGAATAANQEVTAAGTSATSAQAVQGVTGGVPMPTNSANTGGSLTSIIQAGASVPINITSATTTQLVAASQRQGNFRHRLGRDRRRGNQFHLRIRNRNELRRRDYGADRRLQPCGAVWRCKGQRSRSGACRPRGQRALRR